ncbi:MAG: UvrD-helicase domain-containing protein [Oscillospiraceae bacterium]|nr:UvrD-helicase domain-containing protein [Oscillospiraceae bacterium]
MNEQEFLTVKQAALRRFFARMNPQQLEAVMTVKGPVLVLAGAGSGKTTVIVNRIANMVLFGDTAYTETPVPGADAIAALQTYIDGGRMATGELRDLIAAEPVRPWQILAITFTNKAAGELKTRLADTLGEEAQDIHAATFHSACVRILRGCIDRIGYESGFTIYDADDSLRLMKAVMKELDVPEKKFAPKSVLGTISHAKDRLLSPEKFAAEAGNDYWNTVVAKLYAEYQKRLKAANALDFDDLICRTVQVFEENPDILEKYQRRYRYILVDEYQDTNYAQYRLVSLLSAEHGNLCVVGDDDQSIYRFRGATIENILQFEEQFPGCKTIRLEENYRSTQHILDAANGVIAHNQGRKEKHLWTAAGDGEQVVLRKLPDEQAEADFIARTIQQGADEGKPYTDFAVLYRMNALSNAVERSLIRAKIPYRVFGGVRFLDRKEIKDVTAYLCVIQNPHDLVRFERIVNVPKRGIGDATAANVLRIAQDLGMTPLEVIRNCGDFPVLAKRSAALLRFSALMDELTEASESLPMEELFDELLEKTGYLKMLEDEGDTGQTRIENVQEFRSNIVNYCKDNEDASLEGFLEETALYTDADRAGDDNVVSLMTMHAAKGLEFDTVFAIGMETGIFPSMRSMDTQEDTEEERRLAYVTITRAKRHLYLTHAGSRMLFGRTGYNPLSRFVKEIPEEHLKKEQPEKAAVSADIPTAAGISGIRKQMAAIQRQKPTTVTEVPVLAVGDRVLDKGFGEGTVLRAEPMAGDCLLEIAFDRVGTKKLMAKYRKITKI